MRSGSDNRAVIVRSTRVPIAQIVSAAVVVCWLCAAIAAPADERLIYAVERGDAASVRVLLSQGGNPNAQRHTGVTVLMAACFRGNPEIVAALLEHGARVDAKLLDGTTALFQASNIDVVRLLLLKGADVNARLADGQTVLMGASKDGQIDLVKTLLAAGADVNAKTNNDETAPAA